MNKISEFQGEYRFLSNFWPSSIKLWGYEFYTSEAAYQAAKDFFNPMILEKFSKIEKPGKAKREGKKLNIRSDWDEVKYEIMHYIVSAKFCQNSDLAEKLIATGDSYLEEGNKWGDRYWGVCQGKGENNLGKILMQVRDELNENISRRS